jgi:hypothetical protein
VPLPFSHMVPDARMLPQESIRFFYVDQGWLDALTAGAMSIGVQSSADAAIQSALKGPLSAAVARKRAARSPRRGPGAGADEGSTTPMTGVLIRSQIVSGWPSLVVSASQGGASLVCARRATLAPDVLLCLFDGIPDAVTIAEPYQGLRFGVEDDGIALRNVSDAGSIGDQIPDELVPPSGGYAAFLDDYTATTGVVHITSLASALAEALGVSAFGSGDFAIQLVFAPELQAFPSTVSTMRPRAASNPGSSRAR